MAQRVLFHHKRQPNPNRVNVHIEYMRIKYSTCVRPELECVCATLWHECVHCIYANFHLWSSSTLHSQCVRVHCKLQGNHEQNFRLLSFDVSLSIVGCTAPHQKWNILLNSQWFMMVSCKFDGTVCECVLKGGPACPANRDRVTLSIRT